MSQFRDISDSSTFKFVTKSWQKVAYNPNDFVYPSNYRVIPDMKEMLVGQNKQELESLINEFGFASDTGNQKSKSKQGAGSSHSK